MMFVVRVADNFHYMDKDETYTHGEFDTWAEAVAEARRIVDLCLAEYSQPGMTSDELYKQYVAFGDNPFIVPAPDGKHFSAWDYARDRSVAMCG